MTTAQFVFDRPARRLREPLPRIAGAQAGVFTAAQARAEGWTDRQIRRRLDAGRWSRIAGRGLGAPGADGAGWSPLQLGHAAALTYPDAVISHFTAAGILGWPVDPETGGGQAHITAVHRHTVMKGIVLHQLSLSSSLVVRPHPGLAITGAGRTAADLLLVLEPGPRLDLWAYLASRQIASLDALQRLIRLRPGHRGIARLRELERFIRSGAVSQAELLLHQALARAGLRGWEAGVPLSDAMGLIGVVDVVFRAARLVLEVDGWRAHKDRTSFVHDRRRQNRLVSAGWTVLRFTWDDLVNRTAAVIAQIRSALA